MAEGHHRKGRTCSGSDHGTSAEDCATKRNGQPFSLLFGHFCFEIVTFGHFRLKTGTFVLKLSLSLLFVIA